MTSAAYGSLPFAEQIDFFRQKLDIPTAAWTDLYAAEHDHGFMVAGARGEVLTDFRAAADRFIAEGRTLEDFRKDFDEIVARTGWAYNGGRNWRSRVIYETNLRTSYQAGRYQQMQAVSATRPYWRYRHNDAVEHPRLQHQAWDGLVLRHDDPFWSTHFPPNGWGCRCFVQTLSERDLARLGKDGPDQAPPLEEETVTVGQRGPSPRTVRVPKGIDPGFEYRPGASRIRAMTPPPLPGDDLLPPVATTRKAPLPPLAPRQANADRQLPDNLTDQEYADRFLAEFMAPGERHTYYQDAAGELLLISDALLRERSGVLKANKRGRGKYLLLLADTIKKPQEIRLGWAEHGGKRIPRRRYIAYWRVEGEDVPALAVFETGPQGWVGVTAYSPDDIADLDRRSREGAELLWKE